MAFAHLCLSSFQPCPIFVCFCDYTLSEIHAEVTVYRFPNNALIPSDVIKPSVLIKLWRLSKVKLHETEMVQTYIQCILFFCQEQLSSNHKQWVWITHYRRRVSLEMAFCFRSDPNSGEQIVKWVTSCQSTLNQKKGCFTDWETPSWNSPSRLYIIVNDAIFFRH